MLKVVGASWEKTRLTYFLLGTVIFLAIIAIFFYEVPLSINDGYYAATVYWSKETNFKVQYWGQNNNPEKISPGVARAYYYPDSSNSGWATLEIETSQSYPDWVQAYAAGLLEGSLCWQMIYWHWQNTVADTCKGREEFCDKMRQEISSNAEKMKDEASKKQETNAYWHQVYLFYIQLDGLEEGWKNGVTRSRKGKILHIPHVDFLWMNSASDLRDLELQYNVSQHFDPSKSANSLALLKYLPKSEPNFLLAHESAGSYSEMLRIQKKYSFKFHYTTHVNSSVIPGETIIFTSYPASLHSQDDFYQIYGVNNLTVAGSSIKNYNKELWNKIDLDKLMMGPRVMAANRLAKRSNKWNKLISTYPSGTGNKQWLILETVKNDPKLWVVEQMPGLTFAKEMTKKWYNDTYWTSYGVPYFQEIKAISGYKENGRGQIMVKRMKMISDMFAIGQKNVTDDKSLINLMRQPEVLSFGRRDILILNVTRGSVNHVIDDDGFSIRYKPEKNKHSDKNPPDNSIKSKIIDSSPDSGGFHDRFGGMIDYKGAKDRVRDEDQGSSGHYHRIHSINDDRNKGLKDYDGLIDLKISLGHSRFKAVAGPLHAKISETVRIEPFQWSKSMLKEIPHYGQLDKWDFEPKATKWVWP